MKSIPLKFPKVKVSFKINVIAVFCVSACVLSIIRALSPLFIASDSSVQIGAGLGLASIGKMGNYALGVDISQPPQTEWLTWFAPALSIFLFLLMKLGFTTEVSLKIIYSTATIAGWYGWGLLFREVMLLTNTRNLFATLVAITLGITLPLYFTFDWCGTDLLLWAGIPFIIYYFYSIYRRSEPQPLNYVKLGSLIGFTYTIRYAAISLLIGQVAFLVAARKFKQIIYVVLGFLVFYAPVSIYRAIVGSNKADHVAISSNLLNPRFLLGQAKIIFSSLKNSEYLLFSHLSHKIPVEKVAAGLLIFAVGLSIVVLAKGRQDDNSPSGNLLILSKEILFINSSLIFFLVVVSLASSNDFLHITEIRYYYPLFPSLLLGAYGAVFHFSESTSVFSKIVRGLAGIYLGIFLLGTFRGLIFNSSAMFGFHYFSPSKHLVEYPSRQILTRHPQSYKMLIDLLEKNPDRLAISFAEDFDFRHTPSLNLRQRIVPASSTTVPQNTTSQPLEIYAIFAVDSECPSYCYYEYGKEVTFLKSSPDVKQEYVNPQEKIQIVSATLAKDSKFRLNYVVGNS
ncbi:MAG: hypothetical protein KME43_05825 [Myxacorys chilensis ATA2-1-KO14]|jgi:hypothetical protein|nr:hypothetical protein [Myxacorys chilensis ATA2-1-KO14]